VLASLLHLGHPFKAYRALFHLRTSWLSREILLVGLFGAGWFVFYAMVSVMPAFTGWLWVVYFLTALVGLALIYCMGRVYRLKSLVRWNSWQTTVSFFLTAGILGILINGALQIPDSLLFRLPPPSRFITRRELYTSSWTVAGLLLLALELVLYSRQDSGEPKQPFGLNQFRLAFTLAAMVLLVIILARAGLDLSPGLSALAFILALGSQIIGRWQFYERLNEREL
jgi:anaerobic dimethyl sulfoxide reductase subunit C (anchor subunit)